MLASGSDEACQELVGDRRIVGRGDMTAAIEKKRRRPTEELWVEHAVTHARAEAADLRLHNPAVFDARIHDGLEAWIDVPELT